MSDAGNCIATNIRILYYREIVTLNISINIEVEQCSRDILDFYSNRALLTSYRIIAEVNNVLVCKNISVFSIKGKLKSLSVIRGIFSLKLVLVTVDQIEFRFSVIDFSRSDNSSADNVLYSFSNWNLLPVDVLVTV